MDIDKFFMLQKYLECGFMDRIQFEPIQLVIIIVSIDTLGGLVVLESFSFRQIWFDRKIDIGLYVYGLQITIIIAMRQKSFFGFCCFFKIIAPAH